MRDKSSNPHNLKDQKQHRISKVYLKQFASVTKEGAQLINVLERTTKKIRTRSVTDFTREVNLFDAVFADPEYVRYFEQYSSKIEAGYPRVIDELNKNHALDARNKLRLIYFTSNILIRQKDFRDHFLIEVLNDRDVRRKLFNEISLFSETREEDLKAYQLIDNEIPGSQQMNLLAGDIWNHLIRVFRAFTFVILQAPSGRVWFTSDTPVIIDTKDNTEAWMIPPQSEIYFPISSAYMLFMYNHRVQSSNLIRTLPEDQVTTTSLELFDEIMMKKVIPSANEYVILPGA